MSSFFPPSKPRSYSRSSSMVHGRLCLFFSDESGRFDHRNRSITVVRRRRPILLLEVSLEGSLTNSMNTMSVQQARDLVVPILESGLPRKSCTIYTIQRPLVRHHPKYTTNRFINCTRLESKAKKPNCVDDTRTVNQLQRHS
jgi:hypothetical protein